MSRYLLTHSLLNSWMYQYSDFEKHIKDNSEKTADDYREAAEQDFLRYLRKVPSVTTDAMQKGIDFENLVMAICAGEDKADHKWYECANEIAQVVNGGQFQLTAQKDIDGCGLPILLYGKLDCLKAGIIYDIKFTGKYEAGKFYSSPQHHVYMDIVPEAQKFIYLVSNGSRVWEETYRRDECKPPQEIIYNFIEYLNAHDLLDTYKFNWKAKY